jgi:hypothetical protein
MRLRDHQLLKWKSVSARGGWLRRVGGFAGRTAPANVLLRRRHAASDNKTNNPRSIFPNSRLVILLKDVV